MDKLKRIKIAQKEKIDEANTKSYLIEPFLKELGFPVDDIMILQREYKIISYDKSDAVDYAILDEGKPRIFIEAKAVGKDLNKSIKQMRRYFNSEPQVKLAILTDGIEYLFFTAINNDNHMDKAPILEFNLKDIPSDIIGLIKYPNILHKYDDIIYRHDKLNALKETREKSEFIRTKVLELLKGTLNIKIKVNDLDDFILELAKKEDIIKEETHNGMHNGKDWLKLSRDLETTGKKLKLVKINEKEYSFSSWRKFYIFIVQKMHDKNTIEFENKIHKLSSNGKSKYISKNLKELNKTNQNNRNYSKYKNFYIGIGVSSKHLVQLTLKLLEIFEEKNNPFEIYVKLE